MLKDSNTMLILQALYFFLPAYLANMAPVFVAKIFGQHFSAPLDFGKSWKGKRIFGDHKTWRGLIFGTLIGMLTAWVQSQFHTPLDLVDFSVVNPLLLGGLLGFGALAGDAIKSYFKRRKNLAPGTAWVPFDQLDFVFGGLIAAAFIIKIPLLIILILLLLTPALHLLANQIGYRLGLKSQPW